MKKSKTIIEILSLFIFLVCAGYMVFYIVQSGGEQKDISALQKVVDDSSDNIESENNADKEESESYAENGMLERYYSLYEQNNDMVGWIKIDNTKINYPVMYSNTGNEYYLHRNFEGKYAYSGLPFMDFECDLSVPSDNLIIYAHNMKNGTMFADLLNYKNADFYRENNIIYFDTMYERQEYRIISVFNTKVGSASEFKYYEFINAESEDDFGEYISRMKAIEKYDTGETAEYGDKLLTLSTCSYNSNNERFVVAAKRIK